VVEPLGVRCHTYIASLGSDGPKTALPLGETGGIVLRLDSLTGESIAIGPERALRTDLAYGIVDPLLVRTAHDAVGHDHAPGSMPTNEGNDLFAYRNVPSDVDLVGVPTLERMSLRIFRRDDADGHLAREVGVGAVNRNRRHWVAAKAPASSLAQGGTGP